MFIPRPYIPASSYRLCTEMLRLSQSTTPFRFLAAQWSHFKVIYSTSGQAGIRATEIMNSLTSTHQVPLLGELRVRRLDGVHIPLPAAFHHLLLGPEHLERAIRRMKATDPPAVREPSAKPDRRGPVKSPSAGRFSRTPSDPISASMIISPAENRRPTCDLFTKKP